MLLHNRVQLRRPCNLKGVVMAEVAALFKQFIYRDLAFVFGGFIVLLSLAYAFSGCIPNVWQIDWKEFPTAGIILIVLAAYVVGYTVQDIGGVLRLTPTARIQPGWVLQRLYQCFTRVTWRDTDYVTADDREFTFQIRLCRPDIPERVFQELERIRSLKVWSMCVGACLFLSALIFLLHLVDLRGTVLQSIRVPCLAPSVAYDWVIFFLFMVLALCLICLGRIKGMQEMQFYQAIDEEFP
jgi:hypothetical protein